MAIKLLAKRRLNFVIASRGTVALFGPSSHSQKLFFPITKTYKNTTLIAQVKLNLFVLELRKI